MKVLLEGSPRIGKTTLIRGIVPLLRAQGRTLGGFLTEEIREGRQRVGFALTTLDGQRGLLAQVDLPGPPRVGRYGVDLTVVDRLAVPSLDVVKADLTIVVSPTPRQRGVAALVRVAARVASSSLLGQVREADAFRWPPPVAGG